MQIVFHPKFCVNCGEKIVRDEWHFWTSGRFCELCETEFQGREMARRGGVAAAVLGIAAFGFAFVAPSSRPAETKLVTTRPVEAAVKPLVSRAEPSKPPATLAERQVMGQAPPQGNLQGEQKPAIVASEPTYMCGAETKKGTACTRKVKGNVRCWQHKGMPAMVSAEELRVH
ncbi:MAG: hypothetical protein KF756_08585 [Acidobacteria bacterium]|nr:hypothetical protein [Acidobacteriota bacterium]